MFSTCSQPLICLVVPTVLLPALCLLSKPALRKVVDKSICADSSLMCSLSQEY